MNILNWIYEIRSYATAYASRVKAWWLVALIWALVAACVVFFYGEAVSFGTWRPFAALQTRIYAVAAIAAAYVVYCAYHLVRGLRRDEALIDAVSGDDPARAGPGDVAELQARLREALRLLRRTMGRRSVYALPWYALIGPPGRARPRPCAIPACASPSPTASANRSRGWGAPAPATGGSPTTPS